MPRQRGVLNRLFQINRRVFKAYLLKESLERLWDYHYEGAMLNYLRKWMDPLRWQRLPAFQKPAETLLKHLYGIPELLPGASESWRLSTATSAC
jgi:transposase